MDKVAGAVQPPTGGALGDSETHGYLSRAQPFPRNEEQHFAVLSAQFGERSSEGRPAAGGVESGIGVGPWVMDRLDSVVVIHNSHPPMGAQDVGGYPVEPWPSRGPLLVVALPRAKGTEPDVPEQVISGLAV